MYDRCVTLQNTIHPRSSFIKASSDVNYYLLSVLEKKCSEWSREEVQEWTRPVENIKTFLIDVRCVRREQKKKKLLKES